jgi:type VI secretion system protein VasJ
LSTDFAALGVSPIPGDKPAGEDARYEPEYALVLAEIEKLSFSGQGETASWPLIAEKAEVILSEKSKDIQIAVYLAVALLHTDGMEGLLSGVRLLTGLLGTYWETAWPPLKRLRGRANALDWWRERVAACLQEQAEQNASLSPELQKRLPEALNALDAILRSRLPDAAPLRSLTTGVERLGSQQPSGAPAPPERQAREVPPSVPLPVPAIAEAARAVSGDAREAEGTDDPAALRRHFVEAGQLYLAAALRAEPAGATLWRISRLLLWSSLTALPSAENKQTLLPAPDREALALARQKLEAGKALEAAFAAEDFFALAPLCLDTQDCIFKALSALGPQFAEAAQAVREESARLIARLPGLEALSFADGSPFASPPAVAWLHDALSTIRPGREESKAEQSAGAKSPARLLDEARALLAQNRLSEALDHLDAAKADSPSENLHFKIAQLCLLCDAGKSEVALALAEALLEEASAHDLDAWDPRLALDALTAVQSALALFDAQNVAMRRAVTRRIARLRPASALR